MSCLSANANHACEEIDITATLIDEDVDVSASLEKEDVKVSASIACPVGVDNHLHASDGGLYDLNYEPIFTTE